MNNKYFESNLVGCLNKLNNMGYNSRATKSIPNLVNEVSRIAFEFYANVVLTTAKNRALISSCDIPFTSFADEATLAFLSKIDRILACESEDHMIKLSTVIGNHKVIDIVRIWYRTNPLIDRSGNSIVYNKDCSNSQRMLCHLDDDIWNLMPNKVVDIENDYIKSQDPLENRAIVEHLFTYINRLSAFQATSFLYTKVLTNSSNEPLRPRGMAHLITEYSLEAVAKATFSAVCELFLIPYDEYFEYSDYSVPNYDTERSLSDIISKYAFVVSNKLYKYYVKDQKKRGLIK